jgi:ATP phosphoribosyltransferase regulatory subunit
MNYYTGITFKGFLNGIPDGVLSGGRYDSLMVRMGKSAGAIGFAVYLDMLGRFAYEDSEYDVDTLITYDDTADLFEVLEIANSVRSESKSVRVEYGTPGNLKYRQHLTVTGKGERK